MAFFYGNIRRRKTMQTDPKTSDGKSDQSGGVYPEREAAYWREQHAKQPYAKNYPYEEFEHAYRTGYDTFFRYPGKGFDEVEESVATEYEQAKPTSALPWDIARPRCKCSPGKNGRRHRSARSRPRHPRFDLSGRR